MKTILLIVFATTFIVESSTAQIAIWNGAISSNWNTATNWTPNLVPTATSSVTINNAAAPNACVLDANKIVSNLNVSAGILDMNSRVISVTVNSNLTGGIVRNGEISSTDFILVNSLSTSGNVTFRKTGGTINDWNGGNVFGNITIINQDDDRIRMGLSNGDDYNGTATFLQMSTGSLEPARANNNTFSGNISTLGTAFPIEFGSSNGVATLDGTVSQRIMGVTAFKSTFRRLVMSNAAGVALDAPINISISLQLNSGIISTNNNALTLTDETVICNIGNATSYVVGNLNYMFNSDLNSRTSLNFPIGKGLDWRPVVLQVAHTTITNYTYSAEVFNTSARNLGYNLPATIEYVSDVHYWDVNRLLTSTLVSSPATDLRTTASTRPIITLYYSNNDSVTDPGNLAICKNTAAAPTTWFNIGGAGATNLSGNVTSTSTPTLFDSFSRFTLGNVVGGTNSLPVELLYFMTETEGRKVNLFWSTASEYQNDFFTVQRSFNGIDFEDVAIVDGNGTTNATSNYEFTDSEFTSNEFVYYRLKQTDVNGNYTYSDIRSVTFSIDLDQKTEVYPNPTSNYFIIKLKDIDGVEFRMFDALGKDVTALLGVDTITKDTKHISVAQLQSGVYTLVLPTGNQRVIVK